jgi:hypothetical protein
MACFLINRWEESVTVCHSRAEAVGVFFSEHFFSVAGRTVLHTILSSLERIAFNGDPLQFLLIESTYQPFISLFHETGIVVSHPELQGVRE